MRPRWMFGLACLNLALVTSIFAQGQPPPLAVSDQVITDGSVTVMTDSPQPAYVGVQADNNGQPGAVIGVVKIEAGGPFVYQVPILPGLATPKLYTSVYPDSGQTVSMTTTGVSDLGTPQGDTPSFNDDVINAHDQLINSGTFTVDSVTTGSPAIVVVQADDNGAPGTTLGQIDVPAGTTPNVQITLQNYKSVGKVWLTLFYPPGTADSGPGILGPSAQVQLYTSPHVNVPPQILLTGDPNQDISNLSVSIQSVFMLTAGKIIISNNTTAFKTLGSVSVPAGYSTGYTIPLKISSLGLLTSSLWATPETAAGTAMLDSKHQLVTFQFDVAPSITVIKPLDPVRMAGLDELIGDVGYSVTNCTSGQPPSSTISTLPLHPGLNSFVPLPYDPSQCLAPGQIQVQLFTGTPPNGTPVLVGGQPVITTITPPSAVPAGGNTSTGGTSGACTVSAPSGRLVNLRESPDGTTKDLLADSDGPKNVKGQYVTESGYTWYQLDDGSWVRSDVVTTSGDCSSLPTVNP